MTSRISQALAELRRQFNEQLPARPDALRVHGQRLDPSGWQPAGAEAMHRLVHGVSGAAATFGLQSVSDVARLPF